MKKKEGARERQKKREGVKEEEMERKKNIARSYVLDQTKGNGIRGSE